MRVAAWSRRQWIADHVVLGIASFLILEQHSRLPEATLLVFLVCIAAIFWAGFSCLVRIGNSASPKTDNGDTTRPCGFTGWIAFPLAIALLLSSAATHWPASVRFALSRSSFEELVEDAYAGKELGEFPRRVGLYWIEYVYDLEFNYATREGTIGFVTGSCLIDGCGLCYDRRDYESSHWLTTRIAPCWYVTEW